MNDFPTLPLIATLAYVWALYLYFRTWQLRHTTQVLLNSQRALRAVLTDDAAYAKGKARIQQIEALNKALERALSL